MAFCPHCGAAVIQPFMTEEDKAREDAEIEGEVQAALDLDGDGEADAVALDTTGDGQADTILADTTGDGFVDTALVDLDGDGTFDVAIELGDEAE